MTTGPDTVVMIHGLWMTSRSWEHWADRYRAHGYNVIAPGWPGMDAEVEDLRRNPTPIAELSIAEIVDHYDRIIRRARQPPIIMGHSFGGAFTQVLLDRGLGAAGVAIDSAAVKGVSRLPFSTLRTGWPILRNPLNRHKAVPISLKQFQYRFTNHLTVDEYRARLRALLRARAPATSCSKARPRTSTRKAATKVDFRNDRRAPLLFIAGGIDHVSPPSINRSNAKKYRKSRPSPTTRSSRAGRTSRSARTAGKRSPTTPSPGHVNRVLAPGAAWPIGSRGECRVAARSEPRLVTCSCCAVSGVLGRLIRGSHPPAPSRHRGVLGDGRARLGVVERKARAPFDVAHERRPELRIVRKRRVVGGQAHQRREPEPLFGCDPEPAVMTQHALVPAQGLGVGG